MAATTLAAVVASLLLDHPVGAIPRSSGAIVAAQIGFFPLDCIYAYIIRIY